jgi:septal ring factor EnvC (AmiA/AmiB activator)
MSKREARQRREQERRESVLSAIRLSISPEDLADAERRGMNTDELLPQYVYEIKEVKKATQRMRAVEKAISAMSLEQQEARDNRMAAQKRAALSGEDLYLLGNDAYDAWVAGALPSLA